MPALPEPIDTRQRLLEAAGEIFAQVGFRQAHIRDICQLAEANVAAINYHFRDKAGLYQEVVAYTHGCAMATHPPPKDLSQLTPEQQLAEFIQAFLGRLFAPGRPAWHGRLMAREMVEPTTALDRVVRDSIKAQSDMLMAIVRKITGVPLPIACVRRTAMSIVGQCLFYEHARPVIGRLFPDLKLDHSEIDALAAHITTFSLAGIAAISKEPRPRKTKV